MNDNTILALDTYRSEQAWWEAIVRRTDIRMQSPEFWAEVEAERERQRAYRDAMSLTDIRPGLALMDYGPHRLWVEIYGDSASYMEWTAMFYTRAEFMTLTTVYPEQALSLQYFPVPKSNAMVLLVDEYPEAAKMLCHMEDMANFVFENVWCMRLLHRLLVRGVGRDDLVGIRRVINDTLPTIELVHALTSLSSRHLDLWTGEIIRDDQP